METKSQLFVKLFVNKTQGEVVGFPWGEKWLLKQENYILGKYMVAAAG